MRGYAIYLNDPREESDRLVDRRVNKGAARELVRRLNRAVVEELGHRLPDGRIAPLYYTVRETEV